MSFKFLAPNKFQTVWNVRMGSYTADANGIVTVAAPTQTDMIDLLNLGFISLGQVQALSNLTATTDPTGSSDGTLGYGPASRWLNNTTGIEWVCMTAGTGVAVWVPHVSTGMLLGRVIAANMNATTDQPFVMTGYASLNPFRITKITARNASLSLTTAAGGVYPAASKAGTAIVAAGQVYAALSAATIALDLTLAAGTTVYAKGGSPILSLTTPQGAGATADVYLFGDIYS